MRGKRGSSSPSLLSSEQRLGASSPDRLSNAAGSAVFMRKRVQVLLLFGLVLAGLILSTTMVVHQSSSSLSNGSTPTTLHVLGRRAPEAAAGSQQQRQQQRYRWRWKGSSNDKEQQQQTDGLALPDNLVKQLQKQPPAQVVTTTTAPTPASQQLTAAAPQSVAVAAAAAAAAAAVAQPEDLSLILAASQGSEQQPQQQQQHQQTETLPARSVHAVVDPADATSAYIKARGVAPVRVEHPLWWHGPMWSGSGYGSEAVNYVLSLLRTGRLAPADIYAYHHGDTWREHVVKSMSTEDRSELEYLQSLPVKYRNSRSAVVVCHSVPTNWAFPEPMWVAGAPCPPNPKEFPWVFTVGRTMFETDRLPSVFVPRLNAMNEIWVPSEWQRQTFIQSGVDASKLVVVPEGVNTSLYDPSLYTPLPLRDKVQLVFGKHWEVKLGQQATAALAATQPPPHTGAAAAVPAAAGQGGGSNGTAQQAAGGAGTGRGLRAALTTAATASPTTTPAQEGAASGSSGGSSKGSKSGGSKGARRPFRFISSFKWEARKGWDVLLEAYLTAFTAEDDVELYILTQPFGASGSSFKEKMRGWAHKLNITHTASSSNGSSSSRGRSLLHDEQQQEVSLSEHVASVVQQMQEFAATATAAAAAGQAADGDTQRHLLQASSARSQGFSTASSSGAHQSSTDSSLLLSGGKGISQLQGGVSGSQQAAAEAASKQAAAVAAVRKASAAEAAAARYPTLYVISSHISDADIPRFYKTGDAFVLPSRGEGWGRPHSEAMSMGLPVISTNWSGITAYLDESVGYPIAVDKLVPVSGGDEVVWWFRGLKWAQPSVKHLVQLMRQVFEHREEAAARGAAARRRMVEKYSPEAIADVLVHELQRVQAKIP